MASLFTDNAVLQRNQPVPVWGRAEPGATVTVEFAGQKKSAVTDSSSHWKIVLDPMPASFEPRELIVSSSGGTQQTKIKNVLIGEVWICSGQSNMQRGVYWSREVRALIPEAEHIRSFTVKQTVAFTGQDTCDGAWVDHHPDSAVAFSFAYFLEQAADVPVGIILTCWGSSSIEGWMPRDMTAALPHFAEQMQAFDADAEKQARIKAALNGPSPWGKREDLLLRTQPNMLYNAMMHPLVPYACRGLVWYQGESNAVSIESMLQYGETLPLWVRRYRKAWQNDRMHFLVVMLPGFGKLDRDVIDPEDPSLISWAWMREAQLSVLDLPHTALANTIDLGDLTNVHPRDKLPVGQRLALLAARDTLSLELEAQGPVMNAVQRKGDQLVVLFDHAKGLKTTDGAAPTAFWIADNSKVWKKAEAEIHGQSVVLRSPELKEPLYVRYAFAAKPAVNLVNA
ncbi:sialate O-acetylesterase, partial [Pontiella sp.]|uniref:sialate O-acetylesterase n=1 Tax=Pontiella sp. TaxID=2837462 RepID=UPI00356458CE